MPSKKEYFLKEIPLIQTDNIRQFLEYCIANLPDYFFHVAASSSGKYHPEYALGDGGLLRHTKAAVWIANADNPDRLYGGRACCGSLCIPQGKRL